jgi:hypothetical protein
LMRHVGSSSKVRKGMATDSCAEKLVPKRCLSALLRTCGGFTHAQNTHLGLCDLGIPCRGRQILMAEEHLDRADIGIVPNASMTCSP